jgi:N-acetylmuramoyl-L-alanine amidase
MHRISATAVAVFLLSAAMLPLRAQTRARTPGGVEALFADATAKEAAVRKALSSGDTLPTVLHAVRTVVADYEAIVRRHPTSGYCDDALWRAALLSRDAFEAFHEARERLAGTRVLQRLTAGYPSSKFASQAPEQLAWWDRAGATERATETAPVVKVALTTAAPAQQTAAPVQPPAATGLVNVRAVRRAVMADVVRVVIELDGEVNFHDERLQGPTRVFVDLPGTRANPALIDHTLRFDEDLDIVRLIRIGRHPNNTTRVVLEGSGIATYSVYPMYSPYRLVIDCLRATPNAAAQATGLPTRKAPARPIDFTPPSVPVVPAPQGRTGPADAPAATVTPATTLTTAATVTTGTDDRPSWAASLRKSAAPPPMPSPAPRTLTARHVRWRLPLPADRVVLLPPVVTPAPPTQLNATLSSPLPGASVSLPAAPPPVPASMPPAVSASMPALPAPSAPAANVAGGLSIARQLGLGVSRIVIDPGHGGHDPGAQSSGVTESELVLDVALRLEKLLNKLPGVEVRLTRRNNEYISLQERTAIANREGADLFLSIHANASSIASARGVETYFLNFASNRTAAAVAARENASSGQTMGELQDVVKAIALNNKRDESRDFATYVQREMMASLRSTTKTMRDLGVKQAPFVVLIGASMPSILAEISFITNPQDAKLLQSATHRQRIAQALFEGVKKYQGSLKSAPTVAQQ